MSQRVSNFSKNYLLTLTKLPRLDWAYPIFVCRERGGCNSRPGRDVTWAGDRWSETRTDWVPAPTGPATHLVAKDHFIP